MSYFGRLKENRAKKKRIDAAADQIFQALIRGAKMEVPATLSKEDETALAVVRLREKYPTYVTTMLQRGSLVLTLTDAGKAATSNQAWGVLNAHGYFPDNKLPADHFFAAHEGFMERNGGKVVLS